ncbi:hypothetical protein [Kutzneria sp. CA-103260]|uniref:hypothetical protein n=1 Tax=Kutzneria sp. CA-103260 TaxID=2802641 RepID=UPI001BA7539E|nr:hypothetical protein [Kutzneria sp. CA-103260]QUQ71680.1 hypothetical protein JJ691_94670 [Kutzneria sp. CA-103260]
MHALAATAVAAALVAAPAVAPPDRATRPYEQSLEGRKGAVTLPASVTQRYILTLPGSPHPGTGLPATYSGRDNPPSTGDPAPPSPGMIVLLAMLALVGAGALMAAPRWLRGGGPPSGSPERTPSATPSG